MVEPDLFGVKCEKETTMKTVRCIALIILTVVDRRSDGVDSIRVGGGALFDGLPPGRPRLPLSP